MSKLYVCYKGLMGGLFLLWALAGVPNASAQITLSAPSGINGAVDSTLPIDLSIANLPDGGISTFKITLDYQAALLQFDENSAITAGTLSEDWSVSINVLEDGSITVGGFALGSDYITSSGTLVTLVASLETGGVTDIAFDSVETEIEDSVGMLVEYTSVDGSISVFRNENILPAFTTLLEDQTIPIGSAFTFAYEASDPDGDVLRFDLLNPPLGASIDPADGVLTFFPVGTGDFQISVSITDGSDLVVSPTALLTVRPSNVSPVFTSELIGNFLILPSESVDFTYTASDEDGDLLTFGLVNPPVGAEIDPQTGMFTFTPVGEGSFEIVASVTDGQFLVASSKATIVVRLDNEGPSFTTELEDRTIQPGDTLLFTYVAEDPNGDQVSYRLLEAVEGATIDSLSGLLAFQASQAGIYEITVEATDGREVDTSATASVTVNTPPAFTAVLEDQELNSTLIPFQFTYEATDAEGDALTFAIENPPVGATLDEAGSFIYDPPSILVDDYVITVLVSDGVDTTQTVATLTVVSGVATEENPLELKRALYPHFPNPVTSSATLRFSIAEPGAVRLAVYDVLGREVDVLVDEARSEGEHEVVFSAEGLPNGTYFFRLETSEGSITRSMLIIR